MAHSALDRVSDGESNELGLSESLGKELCENSEKPAQVENKKLEESYTSPKRGEGGATGLGLGVFLGLGRKRPTSLCCEATCEIYRSEWWYSASAWV